MEIDKQFIAKVIQDARKKANLTQSQLAEKIGVSEKHMSKLETGKYYPNLDTFFNIIDALNLTLGDFNLQTISDSHPSKEYLRKIIDNGSEKQLNACKEVIETLLKFV